MTPTEETFVSLRDRSRRLVFRRSVIYNNLWALPLEEVDAVLNVVSNAENRIGCARGNFSQRRKLVQNRNINQTASWDEGFFFSFFFYFLLSIFSVFLLFIFSNFLFFIFFYFCNFVFLFLLFYSFFLFLIFFCFILINIHYFIFYIYISLFF